jgi:hypothetical protein
VVCDQFCDGASPDFFGYPSVSEKIRGGIVALAFFIFAISDLVEVRTGAWWKPWWLFLMKAICVCVFLWGYIQWSMYRKKSMEGKSSMDDSKQE